MKFFTFLAGLPRMFKFKRGNSKVKSISEAESDLEQPVEASTQITPTIPDSPPKRGKVSVNPKNHKMIFVSVTVVTMILAICGFAVWRVFFFNKVERPKNYSEPVILTEADMGLFQAVRNGNIEEVSRYLRDGGRPDAVNELGSTPFRAAIALDRADAVREFIKADRSGAADNSYLVYAIVQNKPQIAKELAKLSSSVNAPDRNGYTPLLYAINRNHTAVARELLTAGADANAQGSNGLSPLIAAVTSGRQDMVEELLKAGADFTVLSPSGETAMDIAQRRHQDAIVALLMAAEALPETLTYEYYMDYTLAEDNSSI